MNKLLDKVFRGIDIFTGILTGAMVLFVFLNVVLRMVFNSGLTWSEELARYLFVAVTYIGAISAMRANAHMTVDMVLSKVKAPLQMTFYVISQSLIAVLMMMLVHGSYKMVLQNTAARTAALGIPYALLYSLGILTGVAICVLAVANIFSCCHASCRDLQDRHGQHRGRGAACRGCKRRRHERRGIPHYAERYRKGR